MNEIGLIVISVFVASFFISCIICHFIATGTGEKRDDDNQNFAIVCLICLPLLVIIFGELTGFWE